MIEDNARHFLSDGLNNPEDNTGERFPNFFENSGFSETERTKVSQSNTELPGGSLMGETSTKDDEKPIQEKERKSFFGNLFG
jgi:hypothetical protein